jgi:hypothetical protein
MSRAPAKNLHRCYFDYLNRAPTAVLQWLNLTGLIVGLANLALVVIAGRAPGKDEAAEPA